MRRALWCGLAALALLRVSLAPAEAPLPLWPQAHSDLKADPATHFSVLPNGLRVAILHNATPPGQVSLRLRIGAGSLQEADDQQGLAHFLEHMAFRGSEHVPDGEVKNSLERLGLEFGADTNAFTAPSQTVFMFNLPHNDAASLERGVLLLREVAGRLTLDPKAYDTERGVILSEARLTDTPEFHMFVAQQQFLFPGQRLAERMPIGQTSIIRTAPVSRVADFYHAYYQPERATLIIVGDVDPAATAALVEREFADWRTHAPAGEDPALGAPTARAPAAKTFAETGAPSMSTLSWLEPYDPTPDTRAREQRDLIELIGLGVLNHRLQDAAASAGAHFTRAEASRENVEHSARVTTLSVQYPEGGWRAALAAAEDVRRQLLAQGVRPDEIARTITELRTLFTASVAGAATRETRKLAGDLLESVDHNDVFTSPEQDLALAQSIFPEATPAAVNAALHRAFAGAGPLLFVSSPTPVDGGDAAALAALQAAEQAPIAPAAHASNEHWPYTQFGTPGTVREQQTLADLGITEVHFANGVRLTVKPAEFARDRVLVSVGVGNGRLELPRDHVPVIWAANGGAFIRGGLGKLDFPASQRVLSGKVVDVALRVTDDAFVLSGHTRPADLTTQLQLMGAYVTDPGWRPEAFEQTRAGELSTLEQDEASPMGVLQSRLNGLLHNNDPRWALATPAQIRAAQPADLKAMLAPALEHGPIEIGIVGDVTVEQAVHAVAQTFGALPTRAGARVVPASSDVSFPAPVSAPLALVHSGGAEQGVVLGAWPTTDAYTNVRATAARRLLADIMQQRLFTVLRQSAGNSYTPEVVEQGSTTFPGYGFLFAMADIPPAKADVFFTALDQIAQDMRTHEASADEIERARNPAVASFQQAQQSDEYWMGVIAELPSRPQKATLARESLEALRAVTASDIEQAARTYLTPAALWRLQITHPVPAP